MQAVGKLKMILGDFFGWNKARLECFSRMLIAIQIVKTVNLREIAVIFGGRAKKDSRYHRIKNFLSIFSLILIKSLVLFFSYFSLKIQGFI